MTLPNFLILGAQKAGTTSLYRYLGQHPDVFMSPTKEPQYFSYGDKSIPPHLIRPHWTLTLPAYRALFEGACRERAIGEASTSYLHTARAARRIAHQLPEARLIAVLRDPAERAHSNFQFNHKRLIEDAPTLAEALERKQRPPAGSPRQIYRYLDIGFYHAHLTEYHNLFDRRQMRVFLYEDFKERPLEMLREILQFLGVDDGFEPDMTVKYNVSGVPRNQAVRAILRGLRPLRIYLERRLPPPLVSRLGKFLIRPQSQEHDTRRKLIEIYRDDILKLQDLIDRDLSAWLATDGLP